jgi:hypothetical protein
VPFGRLLECVRQREHLEFTETRSRDLKADGNPARLKPHGIEIVGRPKMSNGCVLRREGATPRGGGTVGLFTASSTVCGKYGSGRRDEQIDVRKLPMRLRAAADPVRGRPSMYADAEMRATTFDARTRGGLIELRSLGHVRLMERVRFSADDGQRPIGRQFDIARHSGQATD